MGKLKGSFSRKNFNKPKDPWMLAFGESLYWFTTSAAVVSIVQNIMWLSLTLLGLQAVSKYLIRLYGLNNPGWIEQTNGIPEATSEESVENIVESDKPKES